MDLLAASPSALPATITYMSATRSEITPILPDDGRRNERTHLFLSAMLHSSAGSSPVHIRNISPTGALIEGSIEPKQGEELVLTRADLDASAKVVWKVGRRAGIAFTSTIHVADWMARPSSAHQGRVDELIRKIRSGSGCATIAPPAPPASMIEAELQALKKYLGELESGLIGDVVVVATHPEIQLLDVALQAVDRMLLGLSQR